MIESLVSLIEGDDRQSLRSKFRTGSLAVIDADTIQQVLARAPLRYAGYSGMRLLQRSSFVSTVDLSSNTDCENLAKQACNPSYFPRVKLLRIRGAALGREALASLLSSPPPGLCALDLANARIPGQPDWAPLAGRRASTFRQLSLAGTSCMLGAGSRQLPSELVALDLSGCFGVRLAPLLSRCTSLRSLSLAFSSVTVGSPSDEGGAAAWRGSSGARGGKRGASSRAAPGRATGWAALADDSDEEEGGHAGGSAGRAQPGLESVGDTRGAGGGAGGPVGEGAITAIATAPGVSRLRALDLRGCQIADPMPLVSLSTACAATLRLLDLRHAVVAPRCNAEHCLRGLAPMVGLRGLGLPAGLTASLTLEALLRALSPMRRLSWLAATVASLHVGSLAKERAAAASAGVADPVTGAASEAARARMPAGTTSSLEAPWCSVRLLDVAIAAWVTDPTARGDMTVTEARQASSDAAALAAAGQGSAGSRTVQDMGPVLAAMPQLCRLRVSGAGTSQRAAGAPGRLVWARGLTQYARVLASGWRELGEVAGAAGRVPSLRRELSVAVLRQALARSPLAELSLDGVPGVHDRVLLLAGCLPRLAHLRLQPCSGAASGALGAALSAADALSSVREHASLRAMSGRGGPGAAARSTGTAAGTRFPEDGDTSDSEDGDAGSGTRRAASSGSAARGWPTQEAWSALAAALAPPVAARVAPKHSGGGSEMKRFLPPHRAELPRASGLDAGGALAALREAEREWLEAPAARADAALAAMRVARTDVERTRIGARAGAETEASGTGGGGGGGGGGPEEESDEEEEHEAGAEGEAVPAAAAGGAPVGIQAADDELVAPPRLGRPAPPTLGNVRVGGASLVTGPAVSDLWADSDSSDGDDVVVVSGGGGGGGGAPGASAGTSLPLATPEQEEGGADSDDDDADDFGAFGARAMAKAAQSAPSRRRARGGRKRATSPPAEAGAGGDPGMEASSGGAADSGPDSAESPAAVAVLGFPQLRQLSVAGYASLGAAFVAALCRMAPPSLRRVDCRGTAVKPSQAHAIAGAISRRERAAFRVWADAAAAEGAVEGACLPRSGAAPEDDLSAVLRGGSLVTRPGLGGEADEDSHAWAMSSPADAEAHAEQAMRCDELASEWCDDEAGGEGAVDQLGDLARAGSGGSGGAGDRPGHRAWLDGEHADEPVVFGSARPEPSATSILVAAGPRTMHMQGRSAVDAVEDRGAMTPCQLDCVWEAAVELLGIGE